MVTDGVPSIPLGQIQTGQLRLGNSEPEYRSHNRVGDVTFEAVISLAALVPHPPLLIPELTGAAGSAQVDALRSACRAAAARLGETASTWLAVGTDGAAFRSFAPDAEALLGLDPVLAAELGAQGRAAWQVFAATVLAAWPDRGAEVLYAGAPFGVGYHVALWEPVGT